MWMDGLAQRMKTARKVAGVSQAGLAKGARVSQTTIADLERGRNANSKHLPQIAAFLAVDYQWLLSGKGDINEMTKLRADIGLKMIPLRSMLDLAVEIPMSAAAKMLPAPVSCGKRTFAVTVEGDAMSPKYPAGTIIYIDPDDKSRLNGRRVLARINGQAIFREYRVEAGEVYLMPLNPLYRPITSDSASIIGAVIGSFSPE